MLLEYGLEIEKKSQKKENNIDLDDTKIEKIKKVQDHKIIYEKNIKNFFFFLSN